MPKILRFYADTSIFGGAFDEEFRVPTLLLLEQVRRGDITLVISAVVSSETANAPIQVRSLLDSLLNIVEIVPITVDAIKLRKAYIDASVLTSKWLDDALHVALATVNGCDGIVSWNFKHIVHFHKIPRFNAVNALQGYDSIMIYSPREIINYETDDEDI